MEAKGERAGPVESKGVEDETRKMRDSMSKVAVELDSGGEVGFESDSRDEVEFGSISRCRPVVGSDSKPSGRIRKGSVVVAGLRSRSVGNGGSKSG